MRKIGIIGLGIMGHGMASNFQKSGYQITVWNRTQSKADDLVKNGATFAQSARAVTEASDIVLEVASDDEASRSIWFGDKGILAGATHDKILITSASLSLKFVDELIEATNQAGLSFFDMPLTGSRSGAENAKLKLLVGGDKQLLDSIRNDLNSVADKIYYFGPAGYGMRFKLILNSIQAIQLNAASQAIEIAKKAGLDIETVHNAIFDAPMGAASGATNAAFQKTDNDHVNFALDLIEKDLRYAQEMTKQLKIDFDLLNDTQMDFSKAKNLGLGDQDWTKIISVFQTK